MADGACSAGSILMSTTVAGAWNGLYVWVAILLALLVMNVQTAVAPAADIADTVTRVVAGAREKRRPAKPVLAVWVGAGPSISKTFDAAGIRYQGHEADDGSDPGLMSIADIVRR